MRSHSGFGASAAGSLSGEQCCISLDFHCWPPRFLNLYHAAAQAFARSGQLCLPIRPKLHVTSRQFVVSDGCEALQELAWEMRERRYNCRAFHCYMDEDAIGKVKALCRASHRNMMEFRVLARWLLGVRAARP